MGFKRTAIKSTQESIAKIEHLRIESEGMSSEMHAYDTCLELLREALAMLHEGANICPVCHQDIIDIVYKWRVPYGYRICNCPDNNGMATPPAGYPLGWLRGNNAPATEGEELDDD